MASTRTDPSPPATASPEAGSAALAGGVQVYAPARLHLGFIDPSATLGRRFGSLGLVLEEPGLAVTVCPAAVDELTARGGQSELPRIARYLQMLRRASGCVRPLRVELVAALPAHAGMGSGTQLALALGRAFAEVHHLPLDTLALARLLGRGQRSGVGIAGFDHGGFILDGGPASDGGPAPVLARMDFPEPWRVLLVEDLALQGLHGSAEVSAIASLTPFPAPHAAMISHEVLMRVLPGLAEQQFAPVAAGLSQIQRLIGAHFAPAQGGSPYTSPAVGRLLDWLGLHRGAGIGQSSWGPTGFALLPSAAAAQSAIEAAQAAGLTGGALRLSVVQVRNRGARVTRLGAAS